MNVFHNLCRDYHEFTAPPLDCARSGYLHTICSHRHKREDFITTTQTAVSTILGQVFTQTGLTALPSHQQHLQLLRPQATPVPPASAGFSPASCTSSISVCRSLASANHTSSNRIPRSSRDLGYPTWCSSSFSFDVATQYSRRSPSADCSHLKWRNPKWYS